MRIVIAGPPKTGNVRPNNPLPAFRGLRAPGPRLLQRPSREPFEVRLS